MARLAQVYFMYIPVRKGKQTNMFASSKHVRLERKSKVGIIMFARRVQYVLFGVTLVS